MGNLKQRLIKAGRDYNYAEGVKVKATVAVKADQIVYVDGSDGPYLTVSPADADLPIASGKSFGSDGRLMVAKHDIPANGYGVVLPWKIVKTVNTSAGVVGDPVFLSNTAGTTVASNLTLTCPTGANQVIVGRITVAATIALGGAIHVAAAAAEKGKGGVASATQFFPADTKVFKVHFTGAANPENVNIVLKRAVTLVNAWSVNGAGAGDPVTIKNSGTTCITIATPATGTETVGAMTHLVAAQAAIAAGGTLRVTRTGANGTDADVAFVQVILS
tara:strand:- start:942 stop:1766 length:825 start_codon:yes stop_codon:yes gene_type:complete